MKNINNNRGSGYIDAVIAILIISLMVAFGIRIYPVFIAKNNLDKFASEVVREAEITGEIGSSVQNRIDKLKKNLGNIDSIEWKAKKIYGTNKIQLGDSIEVTVKKEVNIGFFDFGSFPINLQGKDSGVSEVYWK